MRKEFTLMAEKLGKDDSRTSVHARISNETPPKYGLVIVECGVVFAYEVAGTESVGPFPMYLKSNESYDFYSQSIEDCCDEIFYALTVKQLTSGKKQLVTFSDKAPAGECIIESNPGLIIRSRIEKADLGRDILRHIELALR